MSLAPGTARRSPTAVSMLDPVRMSPGYFASVSCVNVWANLTKSSEKTSFVRGEHAHLARRVHFAVELLDVLDRLRLLVDPFNGVGLQRELVLHRETAEGRSPSWQ